MDFLFFFFSFFEVVKLKKNIQFLRRQWHRFDGVAVVSTILFFFICWAHGFQVQIRGCEVGRWIDGGCRSSKQT